MAAQSQYAKQTGSLVTLPSHFEILHDQGVDFIVRILNRLQEKPRDSRQKQHNPFLPYEADMYIGHISASHLCLLNKFNVVDNHLLIVTAQYQQQDERLSINDFDALHFCLQQINGLGFYNGGKTAGASQHHKHLQVVPLPLASGWNCPGGFELPIEAALQHRNNHNVMFPHVIRYFDFAHIDATQWFSMYRSMMQDIHSWSLDNGALASKPYNLLCTRKWMMLVPRTHECVAGISFNSLGFAGGLLAKSEQDFHLLKKIGPMNALISVTS